LPKTNLFIFSSKHLSSENKSSYSCNDGQCAVDMKFNSKIDATEIDPPSNINVVQMTCPDGIEGMPFADNDAGTTLRGQKISFDLIKCNSPVDVKIYPLFMGTCQVRPLIQFKACTRGQSSNGCKI
jgi:hypothetical protein